MKQLLKRHEVRYIVRRRVVKEFEPDLPFFIEPRGGYVEIRIDRIFPTEKAKRISQMFNNQPSVIDAGYENKEFANLIWRSSIKQ